MDGILRDRIYFVATDKLILDLNLAHALRGSFDTERSVIHELCQLLNAGVSRGQTRFNVYYIMVGSGAIERDEEMEILDLHPPLEWRQRNHAPKKEEAEEP